MGEVTYDPGFKDKQFGMEDAFSGRKYCKQSLELEKAYS